MALLGEVSERVGKWIKKGLGWGQGERRWEGAEIYSVLKSFESIILTLGAPFPSFVDNQELAACGLAQRRLS